MAKHSAKYKKFLVGAASTALVASAVAPSGFAATPAFPDIKGNTHEEAINALVGMNIIKGYPDGTFKPNKTLTRSDIVKMMGKWLETLGYKVPADYKTNLRFKDLSSKTNDELLRYAALTADTRVFRGYEDGTLGAGTDITRENMAIVLVRAYDEVYKTDLISYVKGKDFKRDVTDLKRAKAEARTAIDVLDYFDITNPAAPKFNPKNTTTRGHFASFLYRMMNLDIPKTDVDKTGLIALVGQVEKLKKDDYTSESWTALEKALKKAKDVIADDQATEEAVENAKDHLEGERENLKPSGGSDNSGGGNGSGTGNGDGSGNTGGGDGSNGGGDSGGNTGGGSDGGTTGPGGGSNGGNGSDGGNNGGSESGFVSTVNTSVTNNEETLGLVGTETASSDSSIIQSAIRDGRIAITSQAPGAGVITVTDTDGHKATIEVTVASSGNITIGKIVKYNPDNPAFTTSTKLVGNNTETLGLVGTTAASSNNGIVKATVQGDNIAITSISPGAGTITVADAVGNKATIAVTVNPDGGVTVGEITKYEPQPAFTSTTEIVKNDDETLGLVGTEAASSDEDILQATVNGDEIVVTSKKPGAGTVTVTDGSGNKAVIVVTVKRDGSIDIGNITKYDPENPAFTVSTERVANDEDTLGLVGTNVSSSNTGIAKAEISGGDVVITSAAAGNATITVSDGSGSATIDVTVNPDGTITVGDIAKNDPGSSGFVSSTENVANNEETLGLTGTSTASSNPDSLTAAIADGQVVITSVAPGSGTITVTDASGKRATIEASVDATGAITVGTITKYDPASGNEDVSKDDLRKTVEAAGNYKESYFTEESWNAFDSALTEANRVLADTDAAQSDINTANRDLDNAVEGLVYKPIPYTVGENQSASQINLTFTEAVDVEGPITVTGGTVANASVNVTNEGKVLSITSPADASRGGTVEFDLQVGGKPVTVTMTWDGSKWTLASDPANVFQSTVNDDLGSVIELQLLDSDGKVIDGEVNLDQLLNNPNLIRLDLLPGSNLIAGDVLKLATRGFELLNIQLTEEDISRGFVDAGISTELLDTLTGALALHKLN